MACECCDTRYQVGEWVYWLLVGFLFLAQTLGALLLLRLLHIRVAMFKEPLMLLSAAGVLSFVFARYSTRHPIHPRFRWVPVLLYATFIFLLSNRSYNVHLSFKSDYFHPIEYAVLGIFLFLAWTTCHPRMKTLTVVCLVLLSGLIYGVADEFHQSFIPGRDPSVFDVMYDGLGLLIGTALALTVSRLLLKRLSAHKPQHQPGDTVGVYPCGDIVHHNAESPVETPIRCSHRPRLPDVK